ALAHREWLAGNAVRVEELLNECPPPLRRWEWHYLKRQTHASRLTLISRAEGQVFSVAFSPAGRRIAAGAGNNNSTVWDAATGKELLSLPGHTDAVLCVRFSPDGKRLASGGAGRDATVRVWDAETGKELLTLSEERGRQLLGDVMDVAFRPDGRHLVSCGS